jgi:hypothetical protein
MACHICHQPGHLVLDPVTRVEFEAVVAKFGIPPVHLCERCFRFLDQQEAERAPTEN